MTINQLNNLTQEEFTEILAEIFEHSSWIPNRTWVSKPFENIDQLLAAMIQVLDKANHEERLSLLRAHPQLAGKEAKDGTLTDSSTKEQSTANLNSLTKDEMAEITRLNQEYLDKHGFPFIIAVKNHNKDGIFQEFKKRANNERDIEFTTALTEVGLIARFRLEALLAAESI